MGIYISTKIQMGGNMIEQLSLKEAKELSILKWTLIVENNGENTGSIVFHPDLKHLLGSCGFCERYKQMNGCDLCEFGALAGICLIGNDLYGKWCNARKDSKFQLHYAQQILDIIKSIEVWHNTKKQHLNQSCTFT